MEVNTICKVIIDGEEKTSEDFVAVLSKQNGDASICYNTDALTLGLAIKLIAKEFIRCMDELSDEEKEQVQAILGDAFVGTVEGSEINE